MVRKMIAYLLLFTMIFSATACGKTKPVKEAEPSEKLLIESDLTSDNSSLEYQGLELKLDPIFITEEIKAAIYQVPENLYLDSEETIALETYDFRLEGISRTDGVIVLSIPLILPAGHLPGAAYLNETTKEWEPVAFYYDQKAGKVNILTDHLSKYGVFSVDKEGMRRARIEFLGIASDGDDKDFLQAIEEYSLLGVPGQECLDIGLDAAGTSMFINMDIFGGLLQTVYGDEVLSTIGDSLGNIGLLMSVVEIGSNIYQGKIHEATVASLKTSFSYVLGKATSAISNSVLSASMVSVAIVDYSINKFGTTAIEGREDIYRDAYSIYYAHGNDGYKGSDYWYKTFYPMFNNPQKSQEELKKEIDKIVTDHCNEFWSDTNKLGVDYYVSEARENLKWTGGGAGLNQSVRENISQERRAILYNDILPGVFNHIALKINMENENKLRAQYQDLSKYLNSIISFNLKDKKKTFAGHQVRFAPLNETAIIENWTGRIKDDGSLNTSFTLYGHILAGSPKKLEIFEPNANVDFDQPIEVIEFKVTPPAINIELASDGALTSLVSKNTPGRAMSGILLEDEYKSVYLDAVFPQALEHLLAQNAIGIPGGKAIDASISGSWAAPSESGKSDQIEKWESNYSYTVDYFNLNMTMTENEEIPLINAAKEDLGKSVLYVSGEGTYSFQIHVRTSIYAMQEVPALFEKAVTSGIVTRDIILRSSGEAELTSYTRALDSSKQVIRHKEGIENLETTDVVLILKNPVTSVSGTVKHELKTVWDDETEEVTDETVTLKAEDLEGFAQGIDNYHFYFKYPAN